MTIRIAVVGCGRISSNHFAAIKELATDFALVGGCENNAERARKASATHGVPVVQTLSELAEKCKPDVVSLCTPSGLHPFQAVEAARLGMHVISEKPMATRYEHGLMMVRACDDAGKHLFVVKQNRLNSTVSLLKKQIDAGRFGQMSAIAANVFWTRPQDYYDQAKWRGTWEHDGGAFMNQASHYVDLLTWLGGPLETVSAFTATLARRIEAEDSGVMALKFRSGAMGTLNVSMLTFPKNFEGSITLVGEKGLVRLGGVALNRVDAWEFSDQSTDDEAARTSSYETGSVYGFGHQAFFREVAKALRGEPNVATTGRDGLVSLATLVGAYRSAKEHRPVGFPLDM
ncbi:MAG: Gfo/Idh/MocA family oxidoreductase [Silvanigrellales bacterium]|jgi:UDP-N-acetyl-2-amino-2-deoxyglucuronate dehydrogenase|nr:Gfo/Idh/MocA family oxidoreductase [Silvanigrellales bacterium]